MRRIVFILIVLIMLSTGIAMAAPAYGPKMPKAKQAFWGVQHYFIARRDLNNDNGSLRSRQNHLLLSYGVTDWLSLDLKGSLYSSFTHEGVDGLDLEKYSNPIWGGGYGFRLRLYENGPWKTVAGFQHISIHPKSFRASGVKNNGILDDWQGSGLISYRFRKVTPYVGIAYSTLDYIHSVNNDGKRIISDVNHRAGLIVGMDISMTKRTWINLETDLRDGGAAAASVNMSF